MPQYIAFLRAINVSGRYIKMAALANHFETLGYGNVETFINSGNVVFDSPSRSATKLGVAIESAIEPLLGFKSEVFVRSGVELRDVLARASTLLSKVPSGGELNVAFLSAALTSEQGTSLRTMRSDVDDFVVSGQEVYWLCRVPQNESKFSNTVFERKLKLRSTFRRESMLVKLAAQHFS
jgi:uncharacterized protein (DUF1697 family)